MPKSTAAKFFGEPEPAEGLTLRRSDIQGMLQCPRRHKAQRDGLLGQTDAMLIGDLIHKTLISYVGWLQQQSLWSDPETLLEEARRIVGAENQSRLYPDVVELVKSFRYWIRLDPNRQLVRENDFTLEVDDGLSVTMRIDLAENIEEGIHVIDWKSGHRILNKAEARKDFQTACYSVGVWKGFEGIEAVVFTYRWLRRQFDTTVRLGERQLTEAWYWVCNAAREYKRRLDEDNWPARPSHWCASCALAGECLPQFARPQREGMGSLAEFERAAAEYWLVEGARKPLVKLLQGYVKENGPQIIAGREFGYASAAPRWGERKAAEEENGEPAGS